mmetsp:Transcript_8220/g.20192  ORF Transcript_8220/g.20192 Transcript_8220/m.20192 type:complete len:89 (-) Transcript_8220:7-273(-)
MLLTMAKKVQVYPRSIQNNHASVKKTKSFGLLLPLFAFMVCLVMTPTLYLLVKMSLQQFGSSLEKGVFIFQQLRAEVSHDLRLPPPLL